MYFHKLKSLITFFLSALLFSCVNSPPTHDLPVNTVTPVITDTITPDNVSIFQSTMPIITGHHFRFDSWSPDSKWIGYWVADNDDMPVYLGFASSQLDKTCIHIEVINVNLENGILLWQDDGSVYVFELSSDITFLGKPCETFSQVDNKIIIEDVNKHYSPNNQYQSITTIKKWDGQIIHNITEISEVSSKKVINTVEWKASPHAWAESGWLNNELYLVGLDIERGALYVSIPSGEVGKIITDLLSLKESNADYIFHVGHYANSETEHFYLLIERVSESAALPLLLFDSETNTVEEIPFSKSLIVNGSTFTPDGEWLFLSNPLPENDDATNFWIRRVESTDGQAIKISEEMNFIGYTYESKKLAFTKNEILKILTFPDGNLISQWNMLDYHVDRGWWSPDGKYLALQGFSTKDTFEAIFIVMP